MGSPENCEGTYNKHYELLNHIKSLLQISKHCQNMWSPEPYDLMDPCPECRIVEFSSSRLVKMAMERDMNRNFGKAM